APAVRIVAAVEPELASWRAKRRQPPVRETLHARRPFSLGDPGFERRSRKLQLVHSAQRGDGDARILELVAPIELRRRKAAQAGVIRVAQTPAFLPRRPVLAGTLDRRLDARGRSLDRRQCLARLGRHDRRHLGLENAGLLRRDLAEGIAEMFGVIERYRR